MLGNGGDYSSCFWKGCAIVDPSKVDLSTGQPANTNKRGHQGGVISGLVISDFHERTA